MSLFPIQKKIHRNYSRTNGITLIDLFNNFMTFDLLRAFHFALSFSSSEMRISYCAFLCCISFQMALTFL